MLDEMLAQLPPRWREAATPARPSKRAQAARRAAAQTQLDAYLAACRAYGLACAEGLEGFILYRREVSQAQLGGRGLRNADVAEYEQQAHALALRLAPPLREAVQSLPVADWVRCAGWCRAHTLDTPLPEPLARLGAPAARAIGGLLSEYGYSGGEAPRADGTPSAFGPGACNPLAVARWPAQRWGLVAATVEWGGWVTTVERPTAQPGPVSGPWLALAAAARAIGPSTLALAEGKSDA